MTLTGNRLVVGLKLVVAATWLLPATRAQDEEAEVAATRTDLQARLARDSKAVRVHVADEGLYRVPFDDLERAGLATDPASRLWVAVLGRPVPARVDEGAIWFWGRPTPYAFSDNPRLPRHSEDLVYWIYLGDEAGLRMEERKALPASAPSKRFKEIPTTIWLEENEVYHPNRPGSGVDRWCWAILYSGNEGNALTLRAELPGVASRSSRVRVEVFGRNATPKADAPGGLVVAAAGKEIARKEWTGPDMVEVAFEVPSALLTEGPGLTISPLGGSGVCVERARVGYFRRPEAVDGRILFTLPEKGRVKLAGLGRGAVAVDVTDPDRPVWLETGGADVEIAATAASGGTFFAAREAGGFSTASLERNRPSDLVAAESSEWIAIAPDRLCEALEPLAVRRAEEGLSVEVPRGSSGRSRPGSDRRPCRGAGRARTTSLASRPTRRRRGRPRTRRCSGGNRARDPKPRSSGGDGSRNRTCGGRASEPVLPGDRIETRGWLDREESGRRTYSFESLNPMGEKVLVNGIADVVALTI